jgi:hypothetical protein
MITGSPQRGQRGIPAVFLIFLIIGALTTAAVIWYMKQPREAATAPAVTGEAKQYVKHLKLSEVELKATDSAMAKALVEIVGKITNNGDRKLKLVELNCIFYDPYNQVVLRQRVPIVRPRTGSLAPGETKPFRMPFDDLPNSWNQGMPQLVIAQIQFE